MYVLQPLWCWMHVLVPLFVCLEVVVLSKESCRLTERTFSDYETHQQMHISKMFSPALLFTNIFWWLLRPSSEYHERMQKNMCFI